jgi:hypothetical protein
MSILDFDVWKNISERKIKFDATIKADKDDNVEDEIVVESPDGNEKTEFVIKDEDNAESIETTDYIRVDNNEWVEKENSKKTIEDTRIKKNILRASHLIGKVQDEQRAKEIDRLTGGDITASTREITKIYDKISSDDGTCSNIMKIIGSLKPCEYAYVDISKIESKYTNKIKEDLSKIYTLSTDKKGIGKGEYLLPLLFDDVYKNTIYDEEHKGDNSIFTNDNKMFNLEVKSCGGFVQFYKNTIEKIKNINNNTEDIIDALKDVIKSAFVEYCNHYKGENSSGSYICIFQDDAQSGEKVPTNMLFINCSNYVNEKAQLEDIKDIIEIVIPGKRRKNYKWEVGFNPPQNDGFRLKLTSENNKPIIKCVLQKSIYTQLFPNLVMECEESTILSRDNFVNEYYTK